MTEKEFADLGTSTGGNLPTGANTLASMGDSLDDVTATQELEPGSYIGRYMILDLLGHGGMGIVYKAYDPKLDRRIALKLLRVKSDSDRESLANRARDRLLREAQALAQLSHPNVVSAFDVGTIDNDVFVAMELVEGQTLRDWKLQTKPSTRKIVEIMVAAGRGIAAAHQAGMIHRDIKPENIIVGNDGRVRVLDFGLARAASLNDQRKTTPGMFTDEDGQETESQLPKDMDSVMPSTGGESRLKENLTVAGAIVGTPGYMAPEQYLKSDLDELTDQYSFCATLYEVLYGRRPVRAKKYKELKLKVTTGRLDPPPDDVKIPARLRKIVLRGLSVSKEDRFGSMEFLLLALSKDPRVFWRRAIALTTVFLMVSVSFVGAAVWQAQKQRLCQEANKHLKQVWDDPTRQTVRAAFLETGRKYALDTFQKVGESLDSRAAAWVAMRTDACEATHLRGDQSQQLLDKRMQCLDRRLSEMRALTELFAGKADAHVVDEAVHAVLALTSLEGCADVEALSAAVPPPEDGAVRAKVELLHDRLAEATALQLAGKYRESLEMTRKIVDQSAQINYLPIRGKALARLGWLQARTGDLKQAEASLYQVIQIAAEAKDDQLFASAALHLGYVLGTLQARYPEALAIGRLVKAVVARAGNRPVMLADSLTNTGYILLRQGNLEDAKASFDQALTLLEPSSELNRLKFAHTLNLIGNVLVEQNNPVEARKVLERSLVILQESLGSDHPRIATALNNLGNVLVSQGKNHVARQYFERALAIWEDTFGPDHPKVAIALNNLGDIVSRQASCREASHYYSRALKIWQDKLGPDHPYVGHALTGLGRCLVELEKYQEAKPLLERALVMRSKNPRSSALPLLRFSLARAVWQTDKDRQRSRSLAQQARDSLAQKEDKEDVDLRGQIDIWLAKHK